MRAGRNLIAKLVYTVKHSGKEAEEATRIRGRAGLWASYKPSSGRALERQMASAIRSVVATVVGSAYRGQSDFCQELAEVLVLMQVLKLEVSVERGEVKVVALVGDFEIFQGVVYPAPEPRKHRPHRRPTRAVVERFLRWSSSARSRQSAPAAAFIGCFLRVDVFLRRWHRGADARRLRFP